MRLFEFLSLLFPGIHALTNNLLERNKGERKTEQWDERDR
jgi:hypothetical protein